MIGCQDKVIPRYNLGLSCEIISFSHRGLAKTNYPMVIHELWDCLMNQTPYKFNPGYNLAYRTPPNMCKGELHQLSNISWQQREAYNLFSFLSPFQDMASATLIKLREAFACMNLTACRQKAVLKLFVKCS